MSLWRELVADNPMLIETKRFLRRFMGANVVNNWVVILIISFLLLTINAMIYINDFHFVGSSMFALFLIVILVPVMLHGAIAGEREKRSWDMLLVAPITKPQIIAGKFLGVASGIAAIIAVLSISIFASDYPNGDRILTGVTVVLVIAAFAYGLAGFTLFISARSRRSMTALGVVYGCLFLGLLVMPMVTATANYEQAEFWLYLNPFYAVSQVNAERYVYTESVFSGAASQPLRNGYFLYGVLHTIIYFACGMLFLYLSTLALNSEGWEHPGANKETT